MTKRCCLCLQEDGSVRSRRGFDLDVYECECGACGYFRVQAEAVEDLLESSHRVPTATRRLLAHYTRWNWEATQKPVVLTFDQIRDPHSTLGLRPVTVGQRLANTLQVVAARTSGLGESAQLDPDNDWALVGATDPKEFRLILKHLVETGLAKAPALEIPGVSVGVSLTPHGWERVDTAHRVEHAAQAFVVMRFSEEYLPARHEGFEAALRDCGYEPRLADTPEHNGKICDKILADIRQSGLVVVDVSEQRSAVFFEAGFALGLGLPVIWCCRADKVTELNDNFDTRQYNHILWDDPADLREKLTNRILATAPRKG